MLDSKPTVTPALHSPSYVPLHVLFAFSSANDPDLPNVVIRFRLARPSDVLYFM